MRCNAEKEPAFVRIAGLRGIARSGGVSSDPDTECVRQREEKSMVESKLSAARAIGSAESAHVASLEQTMQGLHMVARCRM